MSEIYAVTHRHNWSDWRPLLLGLEYRFCRVFGCWSQQSQPAASGTADNTGRQDVERCVTAPRR